MKANQHHVIYLKDYQQPDYLINTTSLTFEIEDKKTIVTAMVNFRLNTDKHQQRKDSFPDLVLNGQAMQLKSVAVDGKTLQPKQYTRTSKELILPVTAPSFTTEIVTILEPQHNTSLEGLYQSNDMYCTQCEAEGFRKITYYPDRPDVMARFTTKIIAKKQRFPVLLSNGNKIDQGVLSDDRHFVVWEDPFPKPSYLFALVAGDLQHIESSYQTMSGRKVTLRIFTEPHNIDKCDYAMHSLKQAMKWDEQTYGREYDLDIFMIVAVDAFNMGAMENKGLNIFNSACILARPDTATDSTFQRIEGVIGHEYFHNWSGNRVTCRDWFQLSLKEGFTVFRDHEFSADMNSPTVNRIENVNVLRNTQFMEDAGPMAHPVRPESFIEISNFYTSTVYEKGAEVIRMMQTILGHSGFRKGCDLYFERHDGQAVTCDDFVKAMEDANNIDLKQFKRWYSQAGTPVIDASDEYDEKTQRYILTLRQSCAPSPGQKIKAPFYIPVTTGLLSKEGRPLPIDASGNMQTVLHLKEPEQQFVFEQIKEQPVPSLLRDFSAPVKLNYHYAEETLAMLMRCDPDGFNRWNSGHRLLTDLLIMQTQRYQKDQSLELTPLLPQAFRALLQDVTTDPAIIAKMLVLPGVAYVGEQMQLIDIQSVYKARTFIKRKLAELLYNTFAMRYKQLNVHKPYQPTAQDIAQRSLKNLCLIYMAEHDLADGVEKAAYQFEQANNMTDTLAALTCLVNAVHPSAASLAEKYLAQFAEKWHKDSNVMDIWFAVQATAESTTLEKIKQLMQHTCFNFNNPNKVRALLGSFFNGNPVNFHRADGRGYDFLADQVIAMNKLNPQIAARLMLPLTRWKRYTPQNREKMQAALQKIKQQPSLSPDVFEVVLRSLKQS